MLRTARLVLAIALTAGLCAAPVLATPSSGKKSTTKKTHKKASTKKSKKPATKHAKTAHKKKSSTSSSSSSSPSSTATRTSGTTVLFAPNGTVPAIENDIAAKLGQATTSIDVAMYTFESKILADAVIAAQQRGVHVRVLLDSAEAKASLSKDIALTQAGVPVDYIHVTGGQMGNKFHHKFCIIDGRMLLTGSYNWTESADADNYENSITIRDAAIIRCFETEFDSLWTAKKGGVGSGADVVFAPTGSAYGIEGRIVDEIGQARSEIVIAMYEFSSAEVAKAVLAAEQRGVKVWLLTDANTKSVNKTTLSTLAGGGANEKQVFLKGSGWTTPEFHDKYCVIDGQTVITGSFNWNVNQDVKGYENVVVLHDKALAKEFVQDFESIWGSSVAR